MPMHVFDFCIHDINVCIRKYIFANKLLLKSTEKIYLIIVYALSIALEYNNE